MRRHAAATILVLAGLLGGGVGVALHTVWPHPFSRSSSIPPATMPASSGALTAAKPSLPSPSSTPKPSPSASTAPPSPQPAFTRLALLTPQNFLDRGWGVARVVDQFDQLPSAPITPCTTIHSGQSGIVSGYAATYTSDRSSAAEVVARFAKDDQARAVFDEMRAAVAGCADSSTASDRLRITASHRPTPDGVSELRWWNTRPLDSGAARGVIGLVRVDDRVALISLRSDVSDPAVTTKITSLLTMAGKRLD